MLNHNECLVSFVALVFAICEDSNDAKRPGCGAFRGDSKEVIFALIEGFEVVNELFRIAVGDTLNVDGVFRVERDLNAFFYCFDTGFPFEGFWLNGDEFGGCHGYGERMLFPVSHGDMNALFNGASKGADFEFSCDVTLFFRLPGFSIFFSNFSFETATGRFEVFNHGSLFAFDDKGEFDENMSFLWRRRYCDCVFFKDEFTRSESGECGEK